MAGSFTTTLTPSVLLLLPFFISFHQTSAAPRSNSEQGCNEIACEDIGVPEFLQNVDVLESLEKELLEKGCPGSHNLNLSVPTANETCAFPGHFSRGVGYLLRLDLTKCNLQNYDDAVTDLKHLEGRLNITNKCPFLVDLYCKNENMTSASIASLEGFGKILKNLLHKYQEKCNHKAV